MRSHMNKVLSRQFIEERTAFQTNGNGQLDIHRQKILWTSTSYHAKKLTQTQLQGKS